MRDVTVDQLPNCGKFEALLFPFLSQWLATKAMVCCAAINCRNCSNSFLKVSTFKFPKDPKLLRQWLVRIRRKNFHPTKHPRICAAHFTEDCFDQNITTRNLLGQAFKPGRLYLKDNAMPPIFNFKSAGDSPIEIGKKRSCWNSVWPVSAKDRKLEVG